MMYRFQFHRPNSIGEACASFEEAEDAAFIAGGHTLLPTMKNRLAAPSDLIDLSSLSDLRGIDDDGNSIVIGAGEAHASVAGSPAVQRAIPALAQLAGSIGDMQVRHRGTIGGSVANNDPSADYPSAVLALGASLATSARVLSADDYFEGLFATALEPGEILTRISFQIPASAGYAKMRNPASRYPMAAAFVARTKDGVRVAITGAGADGVFRWQDAEAALDGSFRPEALDGLALSPDDMISDMHASAPYRAHLAAVCTRRAVAHQGALTLL